MSDPGAQTANVKVFIVEDPLLPIDELQASLNAGVAVFALSWWVGVALEEGEPRATLPSPSAIDGTSIRAAHYGSPLEIDIAAIPEMVRYVVAGFTLVGGLLVAVGRYKKDSGAGAESRARARQIEDETQAAKEDRRLRQLREDAASIRVAADESVRPNLPLELLPAFDALLFELTVRPEDRERYISAIMQLQDRTVRLAETTPAARPGDEPDDDVYNA